ncbi:alpha/beta fold hydrolase [Nitratireductor mangrovi]|uniref:alpha/beta fold hydrolase n=1 Tax=Nitratireductor mangrovi TaxID=2599600 RepID=UPI001FEFEF2E|nr:alpha/beta fold hydrolase [Nitratireductor mangrovi]
MARRLAAILCADIAGYSRLMEMDEQGLLARQKKHRRELVDPELRNHGGRLVKTTGDGMLVEFASAQEAVQCAIDIQSAMRERERAVDQAERIAYRVGVNLGDILVEDGDIFGDGVNVASRLEGLAEPGGICVSDIVHQAVEDRIHAPFRDLGRQRVKNISRPVRVWQWTPEQVAPPPPSDLELQQRVHFARAPDNIQIAWASIGQGRPVLRAPHWLNHLDYEWRSPLWRPYLEQYARMCRLLRFDQRGNGLSDWDVGEISFDAMIGDMTAVVQAAKLDRFALVGMSQGCPFSMRYAAQFPEQVSCMILFGGYIHGRKRRTDAEQIKLHVLGEAMIRDGWGSTNPLFRSFFTSSFLPDAAASIAESFDELQRNATSGENALRIYDMNGDVDATEWARKVRTPTLVLHCAGDRVAPVSEGRLVAKLIPGATFIELPGNNHIPTAGTPSFDRYFDEVAAFLAEHNQ